MSDFWIFDLCLPILENLNDLQNVDMKNKGLEVKALRQVRIAVGNLHRQWKDSSHFLSADYRKAVFGNEGFPYDQRMRAFGRRIYESSDGQGNSYNNK